MVVWLLVVCAGAYLLLDLTCYEVFIQDDRLLWRAAFRHGEVGMGQVERVVSWPGGAVHVIQFRDGARVRVAVMQGYIAFLEQLHRGYPAIHLPSAVYAQIVERARIDRANPRKGGRRGK